jgi:hypothetical protein
MKTKLLKKIKKRYGYIHVEEEWIFWNKSTSKTISHHSILSMALIPVIYEIMNSKLALKTIFKNGTHGKPN